MRLATQLGVKNYKKYDKYHETDDDDDDDDDDSSGDTEDSSDDSESDSDEYRRHSRNRRRSGKSEKGKGRSNRKKKKSGSREMKNRKSVGPERSVRGEVQELREMMHDLMKIEKASAAPGTGVVATRSEADIIPLDSYAINRAYGSDPPPPSQESYEYTRFNQGQFSTRQPQYYNRRSQAQQFGGAGPMRSIGSGQETTRMGPAILNTVQNSYQTSRPMNRTIQPIVGPNGVLYYPAQNTMVCYHCGEEGHIRPHCPKLESYDPPSTYPENRQTRQTRPSDLIPPPPPPPQPRSSTPGVSALEIVPTSSAFDGVKVREVSATERDEKTLMRFILKVEDDEDYDEEDGLSEIDAPVMAGERARRFSELPPEFDGEAGPASQRPRTDDLEEMIPQGLTIKQPKQRARRKPICMMAGREKFDFVGAFREAPVQALNWGSFFDLAPSVKQDICRLLVQERQKGTARGKAKGKGKQVSVDAGTQETPGEDEVLSVATDRNLGNVTNFYTRGMIRTPKGQYHIKHILVDAGSVVNLMPVKLIKTIGAKLMKTNGMVIRTATNALAKITHYADLRITIAGVPCDLRIYALPVEYTPTYPMLLSRRWLQAVKAKGDHSSGRYYIMSAHGTRVEIPGSDKRKNMVRKTELESRPRVPIVLRDKETNRTHLSTEVEEELELHETHGIESFEELIQFITHQTNKQIMAEEDDEFYESGSSEDSEN